MIHWYHRAALWAGSRIMALTMRARGIDPAQFLTSADLLRRTTRG